MRPYRALATAIVLAIAPLPALARECPLGSSVLEPIDAPGAFLMNVAREGDGYRFALTHVALRRTTRFLGSHQNGTGHLVLDEDEPGGGAGDPVKPAGISSRVLMLRADLRTTDPWNEGAVPIAYAAFEGLALQLWERARFLAQDGKPGATPPDGLWRILRCTAR